MWKIKFDNIERKPTSTNAQTLNPPEQLPDVYYIILDGYGRDDSLLEIYNYDNSSFLDNLSDLGFYTANCSRSNYAKTRLSLTSSLSVVGIHTIRLIPPSAAINFFELM